MFIFIFINNTYIQDVETKSVVASWHEENCYPSEALFIPRPPQDANDELREDDGVLMSIVMDSARATSFLLVLDASSLEVIAKSELGMLVPISFGRGSYKLRNQENPKRNRNYLAGVNYFVNDDDDDHI